MALSPNKTAPAATVENHSGAEIDYGALADLLGYQLRRAQVAAFQNFARVLDGWNTSTGQVGVLALVQSNQGIIQTRVGNALGIARSTLVAVIDRLEERDLVARTPSPTDRRSHALVLTEAGKRYLDQLLPQVRDHERQIAKKLSDDERTTLIELLRRVGAE
jgi:DNA-binding MarR family transcriptional regulator